MVLSRWNLRLLYLSFQRPSPILAPLTERMTVNKLSYNEVLFPNWVVNISV
jgi:hypothetical protein